VIAVCVGLLRPDVVHGWASWAIVQAGQVIESDLIRLRAREGMKVAKAQGGLRGKQPKTPESGWRVQPVIVTSGRASSMLWAGRRTSFPSWDGCRLRLARRLA
jgi:hypothetical protein